MKIKYLEEANEPFTVAVVTNETSFQLRYKKYDKNAFELFDLGSNTSIGWCNPLNLEKNTDIELTIEMTGSNPVFKLGNVVLDFGGTINLQSWQLNNIRIQLFGIQSSVELTELNAVGNINENVSMI
jgi:hypothetical protein